LPDAFEIPLTLTLSQRERGPERQSAITLLFATAQLVAFRSTRLEWKETEFSNVFSIIMWIPIPTRSAGLFRYLTCIGVLVISIVSRVFAFGPSLPEWLPAEPAPIAAAMQALDDPPAPDALFQSESEETSDDDSHDLDSLGPGAEDSLSRPGSAFYPAARAARPSGRTARPETPPPRLC
jgi:hypothetical protein